jgi:PEP-CTERM motif
MDFPPAIATVETQDAEPIVWINLVKAQVNRHPNSPEPSISSELHRCYAATTVTTSVPEPASLAIFGAGLAGLGMAAPQGNLTHRLGE